MLELVLKDCVTDTNETSWASNSSISLAKSANERVNRSTLYTTTMSMWRARTSASRACSAGRCSEAPDAPPAFLRLALDIGLTGFALGVERGEGQIEIMFGRLAGVDGAAQQLAQRPVHAARSIGWSG